jgi:hypothetical protein
MSHAIQLGSKGAQAMAFTGVDCVLVENLWKTFVENRKGRGVKQLRCRAVPSLQFSFNAKLMKVVWNLVLVVEEPVDGGLAAHGFGDGFGGGFAMGLEEDLVVDLGCLIGDGGR